MPDIKLEHFTAAAVHCLGGMRALSLSLDNGQENRQHQDITTATGADPYSS